MSAFFEQLQLQANNLENIQEQRLFYEQTANNLPPGYPYGYDMAAETERRAISGLGSLALPSFLTEYDGSLQGFLDYYKVASHADLATSQFVIEHALIPDIVVTHEYSELSDIDRYLFNVQPHKPSLPAVRVSFYRHHSVDHLVAA